MKLSARDKLNIEMKPLLAAEVQVYAGQDLLVKLLVSFALKNPIHMDVQLTAQRTKFCVLQRKICQDV